MSANTGAIGMTVEQRGARAVRNLKASARRYSTLTGRNDAATRDIAFCNLKTALRCAIEIEDEQGIEAAAKLSDATTAARQCAVHAGLISIDDVFRAESEAGA